MARSTSGMWDVGCACDGDVQMRLPYLPSRELARIWCVAKFCSYSGLAPAHTWLAVSAGGRYSDGGYGPDASAEAHQYAESSATQFTSDEALRNSGKTIIAPRTQQISMPTICLRPGLRCLVCDYRERYVMCRLQRVKAPFASWATLRGTTSRSGVHNVAQHFQRVPPHVLQPHEHCAADARLRLIHLRLLAGIAMISC